MAIVTRTEGDRIVAELAGDIDLKTSPQVRRGLLEALKERVALIVDLSKVIYIDSSGVACLVEGLQTARSHGTVFRLAGVGPAPMRVLKMARLDRVFEIHDSVADAVAAPETSGGGGDA